MITVTLQFNTQEEAVAYLTGATKARAETAKVIEKAAKVEAPKPVKAPEVIATSADAPSGATAPAASAAASSTPEITYDDVAALVIKYSKANGRPAAIEMLKPFGITALTQAKPEQYLAIAGAFAIETETV